VRPARRAWLLAAALVIQPLVTVGAHPAAAVTAQTDTSVTTADLSPEAAASKKAAQTGSPVEVGEETTPTQLVTAQPDGSFTAELSPEPVRAEKNGTWVAVDTTLHTDASGAVVPAASAADVVFSGGGPSAPLARITTDGRTYSVGSPWTLPKPTLSGSTATYADVLPGVNLTVSATPDGFSENLVVISRAAADSTDLTSVRFPVSVDGVTTYDTGTGGAALVDSQGRPVFTTGNAVMYDSSTASGATTTTASSTTATESTESTDSTDATADSVDTADGPAPGAKTAVMDVTVSDDALTVRPDQSFLDDPDTTYPVVIDPQTTSASLTGWTALWSSSPSTSFWKTSHALGVGYDAYVDNKKVRSLYQFDTHTLGGKKILSATFTALEVWSANCTAKEVDLWHTGGISSSSTWNNQPSWMSKIDSVSTAKGYSSSCPGGNVSFDATSAVAYGAARNGSTTTLGLRAADESDAIAWKQFASPSDTKPTLSITFVSKPSTPTSVKLSSPNGSCSTSSSSPVVIADATPTLSAVPKSSDGSQSKLRPNFQVLNSSGTVVSSGSPSTWTASGVAGTWTSAALTNGSTYHFDARTEYQYSWNGTTGSMYSSWSSYCYFKIDTTLPASPTISSTDYPACADESAPDTCNEYGGVGQPGVFTIHASSDVVKYVYTLNSSSGGKPQTKTFSTGTSTYSPTLTPNLRGVNTLDVQTYDAAGNAAATTGHYAFKVASGAPAIGTWAFDEGTGTTAADSASSHPATLAGGAGWSNKARLGKALATDGTAGYATVTGTGLDTSKSFTISGWARLTGTTHNAVVAAQTSVNGSAFALYYSTAYQAWIFNRYTSDSATPTIIRSIATTPPVTNVWTHLLGVYDAQEQSIQLYVNGVPQGDPVSFTTPWTASGPLQIGRGQAGATYTDYFPGEIDDIRLWNRVLAPDEVSDLEAMTDPATGYAQAATAAKWSMDESSGTSASDFSPYGHTATLASGATWSTDTDGGKGNVLSVNGTSSGYASATGPLVDSLGDFTVSAWVRLDPVSLSNTSVAHTVRIAGQSGSVRDSWGLWYSQPVGSAEGMWVFGRTTADSTTAGTESVPDLNAATLADPGQWTMITGVYDAARQQIFLYVNGDPEGTVGDSSGDNSTGDGTDVTTPWQSTGTFSIGRGRTSSGSYGDYATGLIDDVQVWTGVVDPHDIAQLYYDEQPFVL
jgi:hypothetical protein